VVVLQVVGCELGDGIQRVLVMSFGCSQRYIVYEAFNVLHNISDGWVVASSSAVKQWIHIGPKLNAHTDTLDIAGFSSNGDGTITATETPFTATETPEVSAQVV
jgi:hypothetical protein